jgi:hypothetical protein
MNWWIVPKKVRPKKKRPVSEHRERKQERHVTIGGVGIIGRLRKKRKK